jgi:alcohol dehydrogenase (cytochrome c)
MSEYPLAFGAAKDLTSATAPADKDFPKVGGNLGNQNYSSLTQINKSNVKALGAVWRTRISQAPTTTPVPAPGTDDEGQQTSALVLDGVIYIDTPVGGVAAIDGKTGAVKWKWTPSTAANGFNPSGTRRGVSVGDGKVYTLSGGNRVVALDKDTGAIVWATQPTGPGGAALGNIAKVGTVYWDGMVYVGTNDGNRGAGFAVNSSDGTIVWSFYGAAAPGTLGGDTWGPPVNGNSCALTAGVTPWIHPSIDPELKTVYWSFGNVRSCGSSQDGQDRPGDNLFGNSLVAVDAKTGAYKWHFQSIRHDIQDMDNVSPTVLGDIQIGDQSRKADLLRQQVVDDVHPRPHHRSADHPRCGSSVPHRLAAKTAGHAKISGNRQLADQVHPVPEAWHRQHPGSPVAGRTELQRLSSRCERQSGLHRA